MVKLETERLILRKPRMSDSEDVIKGIGNKNVSKWLVSVPYPYKLKDEKDFILKTRKKENYSFSIWLKSEKKIIGGMGIRNIEKDVSKAAIGYWISENYWRNGFASETLNEILKFAFGDLKLKKIEAGILSGNKASAKLLKKFGAKKEGMKRQSSYNTVTKKICDEELYGILKSEFKPLKKRK